VTAHHVQDEVGDGRHLDFTEAALQVVVVDVVSVNQLLFKMRKCEVVQNLLVRFSCLMASKTSCNITL
jgi:hypothetical protein